MKAIARQLTKEPTVVEGDIFLWGAKWVGWLVSSIFSEDPGALQVRWFSIFGNSNGWPNYQTAWQKKHFDNKEMPTQLRWKDDICWMLPRQNIVGWVLALNCLTDLQWKYLKVQISWTFGLGVCTNFGFQKLRGKEHFSSILGWWSVIILSIVQSHLSINSVCVRYILLYSQSCLYTSSILSFNR